MRISHCGARDCVKKATADESLAPPTVVNKTYGEYERMHRLGPCGRLHALVNGNAPLTRMHSLVLLHRLRVRLKRTLKRGGSDMPAALKNCLTELQQVLSESEIVDGEDMASVQSVLMNEWYMILAVRCRADWASAYAMARALKFVAGAVDAFVKDVDSAATTWLANYDSRQHGSGPSPSVVGDDDHRDVWSESGDTWNEVAPFKISWKSQKTTWRNPARRIVRYWRRMRSP